MGETRGPVASQQRAQRGAQMESNGGGGSMDGCMGAPALDAHVVAAAAWTAPAPAHAHPHAEGGAAPSKRASSRRAPAPRPLWQPATDHDNDSTPPPPPPPPPAPSACFFSRLRALLCCSGGGGLEDGSPAPGPSPSASRSRGPASKPADVLVRQLRASGLLAESDLPSGLLPLPSGAPSSASGVESTQCTRSTSTHVGQGTPPQSEPSARRLTTRPSASSRLTPTPKPMGPVGGGGGGSGGGAGGISGVCGDEATPSPLLVAINAVDKDKRRSARHANPRVAPSTRSTAQSTGTAHSCVVAQMEGGHGPGGGGGNGNGSSGEVAAADMFHVPQGLYSFSGNTCMLVTKGASTGAAGGVSGVGANRSALRVPVDALSRPLSPSPDGSISPDSFVHLHHPSEQHPLTADSPAPIETDSGCTSPQIHCQFSLPSSPAPNLRALGRMASAMMPPALAIDMDGHGRMVHMMAPPPLLPVSHSILTPCPGLGLGPGLGAAEHINSSDVSNNSEHLTTASAATHVRAWELDHKPPSPPNRDAFMEPHAEHSEVRNQCEQQWMRDESAPQHYDPHVHARKHHQQNRSHADSNNKTELNGSAAASIDTLLIPGQACIEPRRLPQQSSLPISSGGVWNGDGEAGPVFRRAATITVADLGIHKHRREASRHQLLQREQRAAASTATSSPLAPQTPRALSGSESRAPLLLPASSSSATPSPSSSLPPSSMHSPASSSTALCFDSLASTSSAGSIAKRSSSPLVPQPHWSGTGGSGGSGSGLSIPSAPVAMGAVRKHQRLHSNSHIMLQPLTPQRQHERAPLAGSGSRSALLNRASSSAHLGQP